MTLRPSPPDTWGKVLFRCVLLANLILLMGQFWMAVQRHHIGYQVQADLETLTVSSGTVLFFSSLVVIQRAEALGWFGILIGVACILWILK